MVFQSNGHRLSLIICIACMVFTLALFRAVRAEEDPTISLVKTIEVREYNGETITTDEYVVKRGDSISRILRRRGVAGRGPLPPQLIRMVMAFNKHLRNPNLIHPGMKLVLPEGPVREATGDETEVAVRFQPQVAPPGAERLEERQAAAEPSGKPPLTAAEETTAEPRVQPEPTGEEQAPRTETAREGTDFAMVTVKRGDTLFALLHRAGIPKDLIYTKAIRLTMRANPQLKNPDLIYVGQKLKLPGTTMIADTMMIEEPKADTRPMAAVAKTEPRPAPTPPEAVKAKPEEENRLERKAPKIVLPPPQVPPSQHLATRAALGLIFTRIGERFLASGQHFLPLKTGGQITINTKSFPIIELRSGQRIVLDLDQRLPQEMVQIIRANWSNYTIFRPKGNETLPEMLQRLFEQGQYFQVQGQGEPWSVDKGVTVKILADWIIWPTQDDWSAGRAAVLTIPASTAQGTNPKVAAWLEGKGIQIIDFHPQGNMIGPEPIREIPTESTVKVMKLETHSLSEFMEELLVLVDQKFESDLSIPLMGNSGDGKGFNLSVQAPVYFTREGINYVVAVDGMSSDVRQMLKKHRFRVITREEGEKPEDVAVKLLKTMGLKTESGLKIKASARPDDRNIEIDIPGTVIQAGSRRIFITPVEIPTALVDMAAQSKLDLVNYTITDTGLNEETEETEETESD